MGTRNQDRLANWPSVVMYLWLWLCCKEHAVLQMVDALCYKPECLGFESGWGHWIFSIYLILTVALWLGVYSVFSYFPPESNFDLLLSFELCHFFQRSLRYFYVMILLSILVMRQQPTLSFSSFTPVTISRFMSKYSPHWPDLSHSQSLFFGRLTILDLKTWKECVITKPSVA
jgi:hypothetical protein